MKKRLLLTGIGGFIGSHFLAHFMEKTDWEIVGTDSFRHKGLTDRVHIVMKDHPKWKPRLQIFTHDLTAPFSEQLITRIGKIDYIINMASESHVQRAIEEPEYFIKNNIFLMLVMLEYARKIKPKAFVQISTDEVYGAAPKGKRHKEWSTILPSNPYSASKAAQEAIAISYWRTYKLPIIITNTMNNFGEMQDPEKYPALILRHLMKDKMVPIHGGKAGVKGSRVYMHAKNHADAVLFILKNTKPYTHQDGCIDYPDRYNIVGEKELENLELAKLIAKLVNKPLTYKKFDYHAIRPGHDRRYGLDGTKLKKLGWKAPISLIEGLKQTIGWTLKNKGWL